MNTPCFVKNKEGLYRVKGTVKPEDIVSQAAAILLDELRISGPLTDTEKAASFLQHALSMNENEHFAALFLDSQHCIIQFEELFTGTIDGAAVYPRVVVKAALACNAAAVIFAHNHPSGACEPSHADKAITRHLVEALSIVDIRVLDHLVVSRTQWVSFAARQLL